MEKFQKSHIQLNTKKGEKQMEKQTTQVPKKATTYSITGVINFLVHSMKKAQPNLTK